MPKRLDWRYGEVGRVDQLVPAELYSDILDWMPVCCVDTVIVKDGRMLLTLRRKEPQAGAWWIQGGRLRKGESLEEGAKRTAKAETGLDVELIDCLGAFSTMFDSSAHANTTTHTINITFLGRLTDATADPSIDSTHEDYTWWPLDQATGNPCLDHLASLARAWLVSHRGSAPAGDKAAPRLAVGHGLTGSRRKRLHRNSSRRVVRPRRMLTPVRVV